MFIYVEEKRAMRIGTKEGDITIFDTVTPKTLINYPSDHDGNISLGFWRLSQSVIPGRIRSYALSIAENTPPEDAFQYDPIKVNGKSLTLECLDANNQVTLNPGDQIATIVKYRGNDSVLREMYQIYTLLTDAEIIDITSRLN